MKRTAKKKRGRTCLDEKDKVEVCPCGGISKNVVCKMAIKCEDSCGETFSHGWAKNPTHGISKGGLYMKP